MQSFPAGEYTLRIWGSTREVGVGAITKEQYKYWNDEDDLGSALNGEYDYDENKTPAQARFEHGYQGYKDVKSFWGFEEDDHHMTLTNDNGEAIYEGSLKEFIVEAYGDDEISVQDAFEEEDELYESYMGPGYFVMWTQGGKGGFIQTTIDTGGEEFDPRKLSYRFWDIEGMAVIKEILYDGGELADEGMDGELENWRGNWSEFKVFYNKK